MVSGLPVILALRLGSPAVAPPYAGTATDPTPAVSCPGTGAELVKAETGRLSQPGNARGIGGGT